MNLNYFYSRYKQIFFLFVLLLFYLILIFFLLSQQKYINHVERKNLSDFYFVNLLLILILVFLTILNLYYSSNKKISFLLIFSFDFIVKMIPSMRTGLIVYGDSYEFIGFLKYLLNGKPNIGFSSFPVAYMNQWPFLFIITYPISILFNPTLIGYFFIPLVSSIVLPFFLYKIISLYYSNLNLKYHFIFTLFISLMDPLVFYTTEFTRFDFLIILFVIFWYCYLQTLIHNHQLYFLLIFLGVLMSLTHPFGAFLSIILIFWNWPFFYSNFKNFQKIILLISLLFLSLIIFFFNFTPIAFSFYGFVSLPIQTYQFIFFLLYIFSLILFPVIIFLIRTRILNFYKIIIEKYSLFFFLFSLIILGLTIFKYAISINQSYNSFSVFGTILKIFEGILFLISIFGISLEIKSIYDYKSFMFQLLNVILAVSILFVAPFFFYRFLVFAFISFSILLGKLPEGIYLISRNHKYKSILTLRKKKHVFRSFILIILCFGISLNVINSIPIFILDPNSMGGSDVYMLPSPGLNKMISFFEDYLKKDNYSINSSNIILVNEPLNWFLFQNGYFSVIDANTNNPALLQGALQINNSISSYLTLLKIKFIILDWQYIIQKIRFPYNFTEINHNYSLDSNLLLIYNNTNYRIYLNQN